MSNIGLYGTMYDQLRSYADKLDRAMVALRDDRTAEEARQEIAALLSEITERSVNNPAARFVYISLRKDLPKKAGQALAHYETLARVLVQRPPNVQELDQLEQLAQTLDQECSTTLARIKGKA
jgi:hypothetical protein